jgi:hypothetical protein
MTYYLITNEYQFILRCFREKGGRAYLVSIAGLRKAEKAVEGADEKLHMAIAAMQE